MGKSKKPARPMKGFSKIVFGDDGQADAIACAHCGATACFCRQDMQGAAAPAPARSNSAPEATATAVISTAEDERKAERKAKREQERVVEALGRGGRE